MEGGINLNLFLLILAALLVALFAVLVWTIRNTARTIEDLKRGQAEDQASDDKVLNLMQNQIGQLTTQINQQLHNMSSQFQKTTGDIGGTLGDVKKDLGKMEAATRQVLEKAQDIANLENLLRAPKFRGGLGELFLGDLLAQILPPAHYSLQYRFKSGEIVDAVAHIGQNMVPIDSKFPLENFKRHLKEEGSKEKEDLRKKFVADVKKHIDAIAKKYILPDEGTYDFALMYIPAENIYYETILKEEALAQERNIFSYALQKRVIPVSPNSFFAYLQVIVLGLKGMRIEKSALSIFQSLSRLTGDLGRFRDSFQKIGTHLGNASSKYDDAEKRLGKFTDKLEQLGAHESEQLPEKNEDPGESE
ncbi:MAG: DNA recombination protein RmuC [Candidatus Aminicenantaceae bacterium]